MYWIGTYGAVAIVVAAAAFVSAGWFRDETTPAPDRPGVTAVIAGLLWPVLLIGLFHIGLWVAAGQVFRRDAVRSRTLRAAFPTSVPSASPR